MKYFITGLIALIIGGIIGAFIAYFVLRGYHDYELEQYKAETNLVIKQKQNIAKVYTNEYYKLANVLDKCNRCQTKYYEK